MFPLAAAINTALGYDALENIESTSAQNTAVGDEALLNIGTANSNVALGQYTGAAITTGNNNVAIGSAVGSATLATGSNNILIGTGSYTDTPSSSTSNFLNIGNVIYATGLGTSGTTPAGNVGIGTTAPTSLLYTNDSAAKTVSYTGVLHNVIDTSATASVNKVGMDIESTGAWTGTSAVNTGLVVNATGGTTNYAATFNGGNVGIGVTTPTSTFQINSSGTGIMYATSTSAGSANMALNNIGFVVGRTATNSGTLATFTSPDTLNTRAVMEVQGNAGATEVLYAAASGNVGIGTTAPVVC